MSTVLTEGYERFLVTDEVNIVNCILIGRSGVGKSGIFGNLIGLLDFQSYGWDAGTAKTVKSTFPYGKSIVNLIDTIGWNGLESDDLRLFQELRKVLIDDTAKIHRVFFVVNAKRFTTIDQKIIDFLQHHSSDEMKSIIHVIVTHAPEFERDEKLKANIKGKFKFLLKPSAKKYEQCGNNASNERAETDLQKEKEEEEALFQSKFTFVDLIDPRRFNHFPEIKKVIVEEWRQFRQEMLDIIQGSNDHVLVRRFKRTWWIADFLRLHMSGITILVMFILTITLGLGLMKYYQKSLTLSTQNELLEEIHNSTISKWNETIQKPVIKAASWFDWFFTDVSLKIQEEATEITEL
eukprot:gene16085-18161_t